MRDGGVAFCHGGEEFTLSLTACPLDVTRQRAEAIQVVAKQMTIQYPGQCLSTSMISGGVVCHVDHGASG